MFSMRTVTGSMAQKTVTLLLYNLTAVGTKELQSFVAEGAPQCSHYLIQGVRGIGQHPPLTHILL